LRANGSRECAPDDRLREAIQKATNKNWIASSQELLAMTELAIPIQLKLIPLWSRSSAGLKRYGPRVKSKAIMSASAIMYVVNTGT
jgi:hypothetical protein